MIKKIISVILIFILTITIISPVVTHASEDSNSALDSYINTVDKDANSMEYQIVDINELKTLKATYDTQMIGTWSGDLSEYGVYAYGDLSIYKVNGQIVFCIQFGVDVSNVATSQSESNSIWSSFSNTMRNKIEYIASYSVAKYTETGNIDYLYAGQILIWDSIKTDEWDTSGGTLNSEVKVIQNLMTKHYTRPSYMGSTSSDAPTYKLKWNGTNYSYTTSADNNDVASYKLKSLDGKTINGYTYKLSGDKLTITTNDPLTADSTLDYKYVPYDIGGNKFYDAGQDLIAAQPDPVMMYIKLETEGILGKFEIKKSGQEYDETYETLKDVEFTIYQDTDEDGSYETEIDKVYTNNEGYYIDTEWRLNGKYLIKETSVGDNYYADYEEEIEIATPGQNIYSLNGGDYIINKKISGNLKLIKYVENDTECSWNNDLVQITRSTESDSDCIEYGEGIGFKLFEDFNSNGELEEYEIVNQQVEEMYTNQKGELNFTGYDTTKQYILVETNTPEGYKTNENIVIDFTTGTFDNGVYYIKEEIVNEIIESSYITLTKTDSITGEKLEGAEFELLKKIDGEYVKYVHEDTDEYITDENGIIQLDKVKYGEYALREIKAPSGYVVNSTLIPFNVNEDGVKIDLEFKNDEIKISTTGSFPLAIIVLSTSTLILLLVYKKIKH